VSSCDVVIIEDFDMKAMSQALKLGKSVMNIVWGMIISILTYKMKTAGKSVRKINRRFPSSKTCSACGNIIATLALRERIYHYDSCR
jgi:putative transposase